MSSRAANELACRDFRSLGDFGSVVRRLSYLNNAMKNRRVAIIGFPYDDQSSFMRGAAKAPQRIREAFHSDSTNIWTESGIDLSDESILLDAGDVSFSSSDDAFREIEKAIEELLKRDFLPLSLGGDHSITYPIIQAFGKKFPKLHILQFDAHPDLYDEFDGNRSSHACPFARIMEEGLVERLVQVGIRTANAHQREQAKKFGVAMYEMKDWQDNLAFKSEQSYRMSQK